MYQGAFAVYEEVYALTVCHQLIEQATSVPSAVQDLVSRTGLLELLARIQPIHIRESQHLLVILDNCVSCVQSTKLRRARDGLWIVEALSVLEAVWLDGKFCQTISSLAY